MELTVEVARLVALNAQQRFLIVNLVIQDTI